MREDLKSHDLQRSGNSTLAASISGDGERYDGPQKERGNSQSKTWILSVSNQEHDASCYDPADQAESQANKAGDDKDPHSPAIGNWNGLFFCNRSRWLGIHLFLRVGSESEVRLNFLLECKVSILWWSGRDFYRPKNNGNDCCVGVIIADHESAYSHLHFARRKLGMGRASFKDRVCSACS